MDWQLRVNSQSASQPVSQVVPLQLLALSLPTLFDFFPPFSATKTALIYPKKKWEKSGNKHGMHGPQ